ncbi:Run domain Beclin-1 interacting and cystein-rich containing protein, partial [Stegodyphus mimosarum]
MQLYLKTAQHKEHNTINNNCESDSDSSDYAGNVCTFSRRSSTSTVRERNNSIDSAFSLISIIDIKEIEEALYAENSGLSNSAWKPHHARSKSDASCNSNFTEIIEGTEVFSLPSSLSECTGPRKKSIFEGRQIVVPTECFFPRPQQGQSLTSFLSSNEFNISAELDRENAHFCISEALIAAIEHMKCSQVQKVVEEEEESDEEIRKLTQRIRIRRRERQRE